MRARLEAAVWKDGGAMAPVRGEDGAPLWGGVARRAVQVAWLAVEGFLADGCPLRASALTLASMLALVPALAISFATVRGLGWTGERLETLLLTKATILSPDAVTTVVSWVDHISIAGLGLMGALFAATSAVALLLQIEGAFDAVWGSPEGRGRLRRASDALMLLVVAPLLVALAASSEAALRTSSVVTWVGGFGGFAVVVRLAFAAAWYVLVCGAFVGLYRFLPTAPVEPRAALAGGVAAGLTWQLAQGAYLDFQFGLGAYNAIYGAIAQIPMLVFWMWTSWVVVLGGAEVACSMQNLEACGRRYAPGPGAAAQREGLALAIAIELADAAYARRPAPTLAGLAAQLATPIHAVVDAFGVLDRAGLVHTGGEELGQCFLSFSPGSIPVERIVAAARGDDAVTAEAARPAVRETLARLVKARREALGEATLADLVDPAG